jgi:hypothetical protein
MNPTFPVDVAASVTALPFRDNSIDCISSNSLFEHVPYPHDILREAFRVLRAGGALRATVPFHFVEHGCPKDYLRFTGQFFEDVCADIGFTDIKTDTRSTSGLLYTIHQLSKAALVNTDAPDAGPARRAHVAIMSILSVCQALDSSFVGDGASHWHSTEMIAVKPGNYVAPDYTPDHSKHFLDRHDHILACPLTGDPLIRQGETLVTRRGASYKIVNGVPNMVMMQGQSSFSVVATRLHDLQRMQHYSMTERYISLLDEKSVLAAHVANLESERLALDKRVAELAERNHWMGGELIRAGISLPWSEEQPELSEVSRQVIADLITSTSWRCTRPLRRVVRFLNGRTSYELVAESPPPTLAEHQRLIGELRRSISWRVTFPLRVIGRFRQGL